MCILRLYRTNFNSILYYIFTTYQDARQVGLVYGLLYLKQIFDEYHSLNSIRNIKNPAIFLKYKYTFYQIFKI